MQPFPLRTDIERMKNEGDYTRQSPDVKGNIMKILKFNTIQSYMEKKGIEIKESARINKNIFKGKNLKTVQDQLKNKVQKQKIAQQLVESNLDDNFSERSKHSSNREHSLSPQQNNYVNMLQYEDEQSRPIKTQSAMTNYKKLTYLQVPNKDIRIADISQNEQDQVNMNSKTQRQTMLNSFNSTQFQANFLNAQKLSSPQSMTKSNFFHKRTISQNYSTLSPIKNQIQALESGIPQVEIVDSIILPLKIRNQSLINTMTSKKSSFCNGKESLNGQTIEEIADLNFSRVKSSLSSYQQSQVQSIIEVCNGTQRNLSVQRKKLKKTKVRFFKQLQLYKKKIDFNLESNKLDSVSNDIMKIKEDRKKTQAHKSDDMSNKKAQEILKELVFTKHNEQWSQQQLNLPISYKRNEVHNILKDKNFIDIYKDFNLQFLQKHISEKQHSDQIKDSVFREMQQSRSKKK